MQAVLFVLVALVIRYYAPRGRGGSEGVQVPANSARLTTCLADRQEDGGKSQLNDNPLLAGFMITARQSRQKPHVRTGCNDRRLAWPAIISKSPGFPFRSRDFCLMGGGSIMHASLSSFTPLPSLKRSDGIGKQHCTVKVVILASLSMKKTLIDTKCHHALV